MQWLSLWHENPLRGNFFFSFEPLAAVAVVVPLSSSFEKSELLSFYLSRGNCAQPDLESRIITWLRVHARPGDDDWRPRRTWIF